MLLIVDTNVLVSECLRRRGRQRLTEAELQLLATERVDGEFGHELRRRLAFLAARAALTPEEQRTLEEEALELYRSKVVVAPHEQYAPFEAQARARIPTDADDWPSVALALVLEAGIWTEDRDFFGCGLSVWRTEVLYGLLDG